MHPVGNSKVARQLAESCLQIAPAGDHQSHARQPRQRADDGILVLLLDHATGVEKDLAVVGYAIQRQRLGPVADDLGLGHAMLDQQQASTVGRWIAGIPATGRNGVDDVDRYNPALPTIRSSHRTGAAVADGMVVW